MGLIPAVSTADLYRCFGWFATCPLLGELRRIPDMRLIDLW